MHTSQVLVKRIQRRNLSVFMYCPPFAKPLDACVKVSCLGSFNKNEDISTRQYVDCALRAPTPNRVVRFKSIDLYH